MDPFRSLGSAETTLGAYRASTRRALTPLLAYKMPFTGEWFGVLVKEETNAEVRRTLQEIARDTLRETIELLATLSAWEVGPHDDEAMAAHGAVLHRRAIRDLLHLKEASSEVVLLTGMAAPSQELRLRLVRLADIDRRHADKLRGLLGAAPLSGIRGRGRGAETLGPHAARDEGASLGATVRARVKDMEESGARPLRLAVSPVALRHLRDEGLVGPDGTILDMPVEVDFGWRGECFAMITDARVSLSEILTSEMLGHQDG